jgi:hypothetical protein
MPAVQVTFLKPMYQYGRRYLYSWQSTLTNDRGEYRMFGLPAGEYYIRVENPGVAPEGANVYVSRTYFPGTDDLSSATPILLKEGQGATDIHLDIPRSSRGFTVSGTVINLHPGGDPQSDGSVRRSTRMLLLSTRGRLTEAMGFTSRNRRER